MKVAVIGCGASGMTAAIMAVRNGLNASDITIYEASDRCGRKILATGNGRCNLCNDVMNKDMFYTSGKAGDELLEHILETVSVDDIKAFFDSLGVLTVSKDGYIYPRSMQALTVEEALKNACDDLGIKIITSSVCTEITSDGSGYKLVCGGKSIYADKVVLSVGLGSGGFLVKGFDLKSMLNSLNIPFSDMYPALCGLDTSDDLRSIKGVRAKGKVSLFVDDKFEASDEGEIQLTEKAVSGIPVFQISRIAGRALAKGSKLHVLLDMMSEYSSDEISALVDDRIAKYGKSQMYFAFNGMMNNKLMSYILKRSGISNNETASGIDIGRIKKLKDNLKALRLNICDIQSSDKAQTMSGGIELSEVSCELELKSLKGLYAVGEILDIDGKCGGYNLYLAWATGIICGRSIAR